MLDFTITFGVLAAFFLLMYFSIDQIQGKTPQAGDNNPYPESSKRSNEKFIAFVHGLNKSFCFILALVCLLFMFGFAWLSAPSTVLSVNNTYLNFTEIQNVTSCSGGVVIGPGQCGLGGTLNEQLTFTNKPVLNSSVSSSVTEASAQEQNLAYDAFALILILGFVMLLLYCLEKLFGGIDKMQQDILSKQNGDYPDGN